MLPLWRNIPRTHSVLKSGLCYVLTKPVQNFGYATERENLCIEGFQGETADIPVSDARRVLCQAAEYHDQGPSIQGIQEVDSDNAFPRFTFDKTTHESMSKEDAHLPVLEGLTSHVSLNGCMQSTVPKPLKSIKPMSGYQSYLNMPGGGEKLLDKYVSSNSQSCHQSRHFTTTTKNFVSQQGSQETMFVEEEILSDPTPQGIQGDNCVQFRLWMENCQRYNLPNCDEQMESITTGRKTLAQVFQEQQEIIRLVAESYKRKSVQQMDSDINAQGQQDDVGYNFEFSTFDPCPQGLQGEDCANYEIWAYNCHAFGFGDCDGKARDIRSGRRTLRDVFNEQDHIIRKIVTDFQQKRSYSTSQKQEVGKESSSTVSETQNAESSSPHDTLPHNLQNLSKKDQLKQAVKQYGGTVIVFHIGISLLSLGGFYLAVSSGLDVAAILSKLGVSEAVLQSKVATGSTTFVMAYAVHKVFAPVRIGITLSCTPFIVGYLRRIGFLKPPKI